MFNIAQKLLGDIVHSLEDEVSTAMTGTSSLLLLPITYYLRLSLFAQFEFIVCLQGGSSFLTTS